MQKQEVESNLYLNNKCQDLISSRDKFEQQMLAKVLVCDRGNLWREFTPLSLKNYAKLISSCWTWTLRSGFCRTIWTASSFLRSAYSRFRSITVVFHFYAVFWMTRFWKTGIKLENFLVSLDDSSSFFFRVHQNCTELLTSLSLRYSWSVNWSW